MNHLRFTKLEGSEAYEVDVLNRHIGVVCRSTLTGKWAATWNCVPPEASDDAHLRYVFNTREAAVEKLVDDANKYSGGRP